MKHYVSMATVGDVTDLCLRTNPEGISIKVEFTRKEEGFIEDHSNSKTFWSILTKYARAGVQIKEKKKKERKMKKRDNSCPLCEVPKEPMDGL